LAVFTPWLANYVRGLLSIRQTQMPPRLRRCTHT
jgi:hypothetical protein